MGPTVTNVVQENKELKKMLDAAREDIKNLQSMVEAFKGGDLDLT